MNGVCRDCDCRKRGTKECVTTVVDPGVRGLEAISWACECTVGTSAVFDGDKCEDEQ